MASNVHATSIEVIAGHDYSLNTGLSYNPYSQGGGGEFTVLDTTSGNPASFIPTAYSTKALYTFPTGALTGLTGFSTFCVEAGSNEVTFNPGESYSYTESLDIIGGPQTKVLTAGAAYLYEQFALGQLSGYHYADPAARLTDATALQNAIWFMEGEISDPANAFSTAAVTHLGSAAFNSVDVKHAYGVKVLNLFNSDNHSAQAQLIFNGNSVPDSTSTLPLLGCAIAGMIALRRKFGHR